MGAQDFAFVFLCLVLVFQNLKPDSHFQEKNLLHSLNERPLKLMKNAFYFILKALFVLKIFKF